MPWGVIPSHSAHCVERTAKCEASLPAHWSEHGRDILRCDYTSIILASTPQLPRVSAAHFCPTLTMGLLTFMKSSQKGKEKQVRASTFTVAPAVSITQPRTQVEPEAPDTRVLETLGECASTTATAVEVDFSTALRSPASSSRRQSIASAASGGTAPSVHAPVAQQGENPNPSPNLSPEVIEVSH